jgi:hypothetical protein
VNEFGQCNSDTALGFDHREIEDSAPEERRELTEKLRTRDTEFLNRYLAINNLAGAAWIDFREFRGD